MSDVHSPTARSRNMAAIRATNTRPEMILRRALHAEGFRFRLHARDLPGRPDVVLPKHRVAIFVHGCFFHGHECHTFRWPTTRAQFWREKIDGNRERDARQLEALKAAGWRVLTVWECAMRGPRAPDRSQLLSKIAFWIRGERQQLSISETR